MKNGKAKLQNDDGWVAMTYEELVGGIQIDKSLHDLIEHLSGATADVELADGTKTAGLASMTGRIMRK
jgi:hypothetical protein